MTTYDPIHRQIDTHTNNDFEAAQERWIEDRVTDLLSTERDALVERILCDDACGAYFNDKFIDTPEVALQMLILGANHYMTEFDELLESAATEIAKAEHWLKFCH